MRGRTALHAIVAGEGGPLPPAVVLAAALLLVAACGIRPRPSAPDAVSGTVITADEIAATEATTMWEALQRTVRYANFG